MTELIFWKSWTLSERRTVMVVLGMLVLSLIYLAARSNIIYDSEGVNWDILSQLADITIPANRLPLEDFGFDIRVPSVLVTEQYIAPLMLPDKAGSLVFFLLAMLGMSLVTASLTTLSRFWYLGGTAVFILLLVFSRTEMIVFPGLPQRTALILALLLYVGTGYYFHAFRSHTGIVKRILAFTAISAAWVAAIAIFSTSQQPLHTFIAFAMPLWLIPALIFILVSATEILYGLVWAATSKATNMGRRALPNLLISVLIYLLVLAFAYTGNTKKADWGMVLIPVYLLGGIAAVIGLFSFRLRCEGSEGYLPFRESGFWLYAGLFLMALGMTGLAVVAGNDPLLEVLEDTVINGQLGMGAAFVFYIFANFLPLLRKGLQVHKVLYKPLNFSLAKARIIGLAIVAGLFSMQNLFPLRQGIAAYFNSLGDLYTQTNEYTLAEQYYKMSLAQEFQNHKGNYSLASLARVQGDQNAAVFYFRQATLKKPSPQAYVGLGNLLSQDDLYFEAMFALKEGARAFPESGPLLNNLGLLYAKTNLSDSAFYFLNAAARFANDGIPVSNSLAVLAGVLDVAPLDSLAENATGSRNLSLAANRLLVRNLAAKYGEQEEERKDALRADSLLSADGYAYWINYAYNQARTDSTLAVRLRLIARKNDTMADELLLAAAHADFYSGDKTRALETLLQLSGGGQDDQSPEYALYQKILGHWFLQLGLYDKAIEAFLVSDDPDAVIGHAMAQTFSGNPLGSTLVLEKLKVSGRDTAEIGRIQQSVLSLKPLRSRADSVLSVAGRENTERAFRAALRFNPYDPEIVTGVVNFLTQRKTAPGEAYQIVVDALRFNERSHILWGHYALLSLDLGLSEQADEGRTRVSELASDTDYHGFFTHYQAKWSLKQKEKEEFK